MKAVILHGTGSDHTSNWFPWLKTELEKMGYKVWAPDLPSADRPDIDRYNSFLLGAGWGFADNLLIGHSSGAVETVALLQALPAGQVADTAILVGTFRGSLGRDDLKGMNTFFNYLDIKTKAKKFIVIHADNDPFCPIEDSKWIAAQLGAEFVLMPGQQHFEASQDPKFVQFPELLEIIKTKVPAK